MSDFVKQLSSYNLLNYLLTGVVFVVLAEHFTTFSFLLPNSVLAVFEYYLIGIIVSRVGSLIIEPVLKKIKFRDKRFIEFALPRDFIVASAIDPKLVVLSETNNVYRSILAAILCVLALLLVQVIERWKPSISSNNHWVLLVGLLFLFVFSYRKQVRHIRERVAINIKLSSASEEQGD